MLILNELETFDIEAIPLKTLYVDSNTGNVIYVPIGFDINEYEMHQRIDS